MDGSDPRTAQVMNSQPMDPCLIPTASGKTAQALHENPST